MIRKGELYRKKRNIASPEIYDFYHLLTKK